MRIMFTTAAVCAAIGISGVAAAQTNQPLDLTPTGVTVRAGVALPFDSSLTDVGNTLINIGVEYQPGNSLLKGSDTFYSVDLFTPSIRLDRGTVVPVAINQRWYHGGPDVFRRGYVFAGVGPTFIDVDKSRIALGGRVGIGQELGEHVVAEIAGYISDKAGGARANSITFNLGYRF